MAFQLLHATLAARKMPPQPPPVGPPAALLQISAFCFSLNAVCCFLSAAALIMQPPKPFSTSQARRYAQLCGFGFLALGLVSWYQRDLVSALAISIYNAAFALLTWPMRMPGPPAIKPVEKFFVVLSVATTCGILPVIFM